MSTLSDHTAWSTGDTVFFCAWGGFILLCCVPCFVRYQLPRVWEDAKRRGAAFRHWGTRLSPRTAVPQDARAVERTAVLERVAEERVLAGTSRPGTLVKVPFVRDIPTASPVEGRDLRGP